MISQDEHERIEKFIKNPVKEGLWESVFTWDNESRINKVINGNSDLRPVHNTNPIKIFETLKFLVDDEEYPLNEIAKKNTIPAPQKPFYLKSSDDDIKKLFTKFEEIKKIQINYVDSFHSYIIINGDLNHILQYPQYQDNTLIVLSTNKEASKNIYEILSSCNAVKDDFRIKPRWSPQDKLRHSMFNFTNSIVHSLFIADYQVKTYFIKAYNAYFQNQYDDTIAHLGKATEVLLTNIYESLFREYPNTTDTMGSLLGSIESKVNEVYSTKNNEIEPANFDEVRKFIENEFNKNDDKDKNYKGIFHQIITSLKKEQKYHKHLLKEKSSANQHQIFPKHIHNYLKEIVKDRNAVSHNSSKFFNMQDCQNVLFYFLEAYNWWQKIYNENSENNNENKVDWSKDKNKIIQKIIELRNSF